MAEIFTNAFGRAQGQSRQNELLRLAQQQRGQDIQSSMRQRATEEAVMFNAALGADFDPTQNPEMWAQARMQLAQAGGDVSGISETYNPQQHQAIAGLARQKSDLTGGRVQSSKVFGDGTTLTIMRDNTRVITDPTGKVLEGEDARKAIEAAAQFDIDKAAGKARSVKQAEADVELETAGRIASVVKQAQISAAKSEDLNDQIAAYEANNPALQEVVGDLKDLADMATHTKLGKLFDATVRELGFGATEGATAAAKYGAIVSNQVLPLLKATLGSQFTNEERKALEATMGDQDLSAAEKHAQLDAFLKQKDLTLESLKRERDIRAGNVQAPSEKPQGQSFTSSGGIQFTVSE